MDYGYPDGGVLLLLLTGVKVQKLCLGVDYIVSIKFTEPRKFLLSVTSGILEALTGPW